MRDSLAIRSQRFHGRIDPQIAIGPVGVLPALMPVKRGFDSRIARAEELQRLLDPFRFAHCFAIGSRQREFAGRPLGNHYRLMRIKPADLLIRPVHKRRYVWIRFILVLLPVDAETKPIDVI